MAEKKVRTRVQSKHDVEKNWASATFVPLPGEIIIYDKDKGVNGGTHEKPRIKVGDGTTAVGSLPFVVDKEATDAAIAAAKATVVSASEQQNFTDEQKETARNNIGAVDASLVVSEIHSSDAIPNGAALANFATNNCVMAAIEQNLSDVDKRKARANIGAVSQAELDEAIANVDGSGGFIDNCLDSESTNPVENKAVTEECNAIWNELNTAARMQYVDNNFVSTLFEQGFEDGQKATARSNIGAVSQAELDEAIANAGGGVGGGNFISYTETQDLTDEQKEIARNNINAVDASLVTDNVDNWNKIPNGNGLVNFFVSEQGFSPEQKQTARENIGAVSQAELDEAIANAGGGGGGFVSYTETQDLADEQKATARGNINAVDASLVTDNLNSSEKIPNGAGLTNFLSESLHHFDVVSYNSKQITTNKQKATARDNIEVDGGKWELLYTIEGDGETSLWEYTQFADGSPLKLTAVSAVVIQDVAEAEKSYGHLYAYCNAKSTQFPAAIYSYFTKNTAPTTPGTQRAYGVVEQYKGQYRAYSVGMAEKGNEVMRYTPYMQGKSTTSDHPYIDHIKIHKQTGVFSAGNKIEVYGVRYYV